MFGPHGVKGELVVINTVNLTWARVTWKTSGYICDGVSRWNSWAWKICLKYKWDHYVGRGLTLMQKRKWVQRWHPSLCFLTENEKWPIASSSRNHAFLATMWDIPQICLYTSLIVAFSLNFISLLSDDPSLWQVDRKLTSTWSHIGPLVS